MYVATVCLEQRLRDFYMNIKGFNYSEKSHVIGQLLDYFGSVRNDPGIILLPGGYFSTDDYPAEFLTEMISNNIQYELAIRDLNNVMVCTGVDAMQISPDSDIFREQVAVAVDSQGVKALGRKWFATKAEKAYLKGALNWHIPERNHERVFEHGGKKFYMAVCYDSFGLRKQKIPNPGVHGVLNVVHKFMPVGKGNSGNVYFAKHGFAGLSNQWGVPVFGATTFYGRELPNAWPTAVKTDKYSQKWLYTQNDMKPDISYTFEKTKLGNIKARVFTL